jgi:3-hydroxyacyl-CoA dehydrogenase
MGDEKPKVFETSFLKPGLSLNRRNFLKLIGGGIIVFFTCDAADLFGQERRGPGYPTDFNAYLRIAEDGKVTVFSGKIEMGQGVITSLAQMAADELGVALESIDMVMGDTDLCPWDGGTWGSQSIQTFGPIMRAAAAEARAVLLELGAEHLKLPVSQLEAKDGKIADADFVIEAAFEREDVKHKIFDQCQVACPKNAIFASNSSHMEPEVIFQKMNDKTRCLVIHYFFPAERNILLEIVPMKETDPALVEYSMKFYEFIGKTNAFYLNIVST